jgi:hypothetical protein
MTAEPAATWFRCAFCGLANGLAARYGGPLYLVGSALWLSEPNDFDVRVVLSEHDADRLFGEVKPVEWIDGIPIQPQWMRILREELKQGRRAARVLGVNVDFQFQSFERFIRQDGPRLRLDSHPKFFFLAGMTDA